MPSALPQHVRHQIIEQKTGGASLLDIAEDQQLSYSTVGNIWKRFKAEGIPGLTPHYHKCGSSGSKQDPLIYRAAVWLKRHHQSWGAALICIMLKERYKDASVPGERTLQRWFKAQGVSKPKSWLMVSDPMWAAQVHDVWQIDAKEKLHLSSGQKACYLSIVDEKSGCLLNACVFPPVQYQ